MQAMATDHAGLEAHAAAVKAREDAARAELERHREIWGDGPPYYSTATFAFWQALAAGRFHLARCGSCAHVYFPPRVVCPSCWAQDAGELRDTPGAGSLVTFTDLHVTAPALQAIAPVRLAVIDLDEGVRVLTWLRGDGAAAAEPGSRCVIGVEEVLGRAWFTATPARAAA